MEKVAFLQEKIIEVLQEWLQEYRMGPGDVLHAQGPVCHDASTSEYAGDNGMIHIRLTALFIASALVLATWYMVRRKKLKISYALLWLSVGISFVLITVVPGILEFLSRITGLYYITALLVVGFTFLILLLLHFSSVVSKLTYENRMLAHRMAFLEEKIHRKSENGEEIEYYI